MTHDRVGLGNCPIVLDLGNNGPLSREQVVAVFELAKEQPKIIVVNTAVPRPWKDANNALIDEVARGYARTTVIDWSSISEGHPEYFAPDGVHLVPTGVAVYVAEIEKYL